jgi:tRNA A-37 threonylcarbamoyl transferase component Bud32
VSSAPVDPPVAAPREAVPFGEMLVREGLVPRDELDRIIALQEAEARRGVFLRLGELLVARGLLDEQTVARVLALQGRAILVCAACVVQFNVVDWSPGKVYPCSRCGGRLDKPEALRRLTVEDTVRAREPGAPLVAEGAERTFGPYVILGEISRGGMGIIYKARQRGLERVVAMKIMSGDARPEDVERFLREARAVARLRHPYIVAVHEIGRLEKIDYFTMDYIEGQPLHRAATAEGMNERELVELFVKVCDAVSYSHTQGVLHRDLKPQNIIVDRKRDPVLIDFGIADLDGTSTENSDELVGSPAYLPPEYVQGSAPYGVPGEVYGLGATIYTVLAGRPPHTGIDTVQVLRRAQVEDVTPIRRVRSTIDRDLATIVMTAVARDPAARYATAQDLANDLRRWLEGDEIAGRRDTLFRLWQRVRSKVAAALGLFMSLLFLVVSASYNVQLHALREEDAARLEQLDRETQAIYRSLVDKSLELARVQLSAGKAKEAHTALTELLQQTYATPFAGRIHALRATARAALGDIEGSESDARAAAQLGGGAP